MPGSSLRFLRAARSDAKKRFSRWFKPRLETLEDRLSPVATPWFTFGGNSQHTSLSSVASQPIEAVHWQTPVDNYPTSRAAHYGGPLITLANTVIYPYKTTTTGDFHVLARSGNDGSLLWDVSTDWVPASYNWYPPYQPVLTTATNRVYFAGQGGTLYYRDNPDSAGGTVTQLAFFGTLGDYQSNKATYDSRVFIDTPITADSQGNVYFGFRVTGATPAALSSGIARISASGVGSWVSAQTAANNDGSIGEVAHNAGFALSNDEQMLYLVTKSASTSYYGRLVGLNSSTLTTSFVTGVLKDPRNGGANNAGILGDTTASPMVAPDGKVFLGVFGNPYNGSRGWMLQFSANLATQYAPGGFGWDTTPSIVPASMVPQYSGSSDYLVFTKYNNYYGITDGGDGSNMIAVLDPNATEPEFHPSSNGLPVMKRVLYKVGPTHDWDYANVPTAVREWCINYGAVDPATRSIMVNSADGKFYRWYLPTNTLTEQVQLTSGIGQPYTMTVIGVDGTLYGIQIGTLFALGRTPQLAISDPTVTEGTGGTANATFTVSLDFPRTQAITVNYATADGTAVAGSDYSSTSGSLTFNPGEKTKTVTVVVNSDALDEANESFFVNLTSPSNATILDGQGQAVIVDDDPAPNLSINDVSANEGNSGPTAFTFILSLSTASGQTVTVNYASADDTAGAPDDYQSGAGSVTFSPGETTKTITVQVNGDGTFESNETFFVNLSEAVNATLLDGQGQGIIINDDGVPSIAVDDVSVMEGSSITFTISLSNSSSQTITVDFATANGTALGGSDYTAGAGTLSFAPGETTMTVSVDTMDDALNEQTENFFLNLANPVNAFISDDQGEGSIIDNDPEPTLAIDDVSANEGMSGVTTLTFTVSLSVVSGRTVTVNYATADGTATVADNDYQSGFGTVTFTAGETSKSIAVLVNGDNINEPDETFVVNLSNAVGAGILDGQGQATILNDDALILSIDDAVLAEGDSGSNAFTFTVSLSTPSSQTVTVDYASADGSATVADGDYAARADTLTFMPGETSKSFTVQVNGDATNEADESFLVNLSNPSGGTLGDAQGQGTILNDDAVPSLAIADVTVPEGDYNISTINIYVTLSAPSGQTVTVRFETFNGTASSTTATKDYIDTLGTLTFMPGETVKSFPVSIVGDTIDELDEDFFSRLMDPVNATLGDDESRCLIIDDDTSAISITDASVIESDNGSTAVEVTLSLSVPSDRTIAVDYATDNDTAEAPLDYQSDMGTITFGPGQTVQTLVLQVNGDLLDELDELFCVDLSNATGGGVFNDAESMITIVDDDTASLSVNDISILEGDSGATDAVFTIRLSNPSDRFITVDFLTDDDTAHTPGDYESTAGSLSFAPGDTAQTVTLRVHGDRVDEFDELFCLDILNPTGGAVIGDADGMATIVDDDTAGIVINDITVTEGTGGTTAAILTISLTIPSDHFLGVDFATADGTAVAPGDYTANSGAVSFAPGDTSLMLTISLNADSFVEPNETFFVNLTGATGGATIDDPQGRALIADDDAGGFITNDVTVTEGDSNSLTVKFKISLTGSFDHTVSVSYATANGTATAPGDYTAVSGSKSFAPGVTSKNVKVVIVGDTIDEFNETFFVNLFNPTSGAPIYDAQGQATIVDTDTAGFALNDVSVTEGHAGTVAASFTVSLTMSADHPVSVSYATADGTAVAPGDYQSAAGLLTIAAGKTSKKITILVNGDRTGEPNESFVVNLTNPVDGVIVDGQGHGTIVDDEPRITINDVSKLEGNTGLTLFVFTVRLSVASDVPVTVGYSTADGTATSADRDYDPTNGTLTFAPGETAKTITASIRGDRKREATETFFANLANAVNGFLLDAQAIGTILNDDA